MRASWIAFVDLCVMSDQRDWEVMTDPRLAKEPILRAEPKEPMEPMEHAEPTEPIDRNDPFDPIDRNESRDHNDHIDMARLSHSAPCTS